MMVNVRELGIVLPVLMALVLGACDADTQTTVDPVVAPEVSREAAVQPKLDEARYLLDPVTVKRITVWPVCSQEPESVGEFVTLSQAEEAGCATIREDTSQGGGRVNRVVVENRGHVPILIVAGTIIKGGKQDRQIGQDSVVQARSETKVETFCVERGRWSLRGNCFRDGPRMGAARGGAFRGASAMVPKEVRESAQYEADQAQVWHMVRISNALAKKSPQTETIVDTVEESDTERKAVRGGVADAIKKHFDSIPDEEQVVGFANALGSKPMGMRVFADTRLFEAYFPEFVKSLAMETDLADRIIQRGVEVLDDDAEYDMPDVVRPPSYLTPETLNAKPPSAADVIRMVNGINAASEKDKSNPADNRIGIRTNATGGSAKCYVPKGNAWITLSQDWTAK